MELGFLLFFFLLTVLLGSQEEEFGFLVPCTPNWDWIDPASVCLWLGRASEKVMNLPTCLGSSAIDELQEDNYGPVEGGILLVGTRAELSGFGYPSKGDHNSSFSKAVAAIAALM